jgi:hypothetical protein
MTKQDSKQQETVNQHEQFKTNPVVVESKVSAPTGFLPECLEIAQTQNAVNIKMAGANWVQRAQSGELNYHLAILDEAAEFLRSAIPFKWWAVPKLDENNAILELVDILHFLTSHVIVCENGDVDKAADIMAESLGQACLDILPGDDTHTPKFCLIDFMQALFTGAEDESYNVFYSFWSLCLSVTNPGLIVSLYRAKAQLNIFRASNGQKEGLYKKIWFDGKEDNEFVVSFVRECIEQTGTYPGNEALQEFMTNTYATALRATKA